MALGVTVDFTANDVRWTQQIDRMSQNLDSFRARSEVAASRISGALGAIGIGLSVAAFTSFAKNGIDAADALNDMSDRTGIAIEKLAGLNLAVKLGDTNMEAFQASSNKLSIFMAKNSDAMKQLGVSAKDPVEAFKQFSTVFASIDDPQRKAALGAAVLGKSYAEMAPLLNLGGDGIQTLISKGQQFEPITAALAEGAGRFNDRLDEMETHFSGLSAYLGGRLATGFEQLVEYINMAKQSASGLNAVLKGISNFTFSADAERGLTAGIATINDKIVAQKEKINSLKNEGGIGGLIDGLLGYDINAEKGKLDNLLSQRDQLISDYAQKQNSSVNPAKPSNTAVNNVIGIKDDVGNTAKHTSALRQHKSAVDDVAKAEQSRAKSIQQLIENLQLEVDSYQVEASQRAESIEITRAIKDARGDEVTSIAALVNQKYALKEAEDIELKRQQALIESAKQYSELLYQVGIAADSNLSGDKLNSMLAQIDDARANSAITDDQAKKMQDQLGAGFNSSVEDIKKSGDTMSTYADQAARNMQNSFSQFLFDPFNAGATNMVTSFAQTMAQMASQMASSKIMELLSGKTGVKDGGGLLGQAFSAASPMVSSAFSGVGTFLSSFFHDGGMAGSGSKYMSVDPSVFAHAQRYHTGGIAGLKPDEVPAILQRGERVIARNQKMSSNDVSMNTTIHVNGSSDDSSAQALSNKINMHIRSILNNEMRPGGLLAKGHA